MEVVTPQSARNSGGAWAVTVGAYDGVHLGHQAVLRALKVRASELGLGLAVATFDRHPASVVRPDRAPKLLCDLETKLELLAACGVDRTCVIEFNQQRSEEAPDVFVRDVLVDALGAKLIVVGANFHFGRDRKGDVALLKVLGDEMGFEADGIELTTAENEAISSTRIRSLVASSDVEGAAALLGRAFSVSGTVVHGDGRGGPELGYPTANVAVPEAMAIPGTGIYAGFYIDQGGHRRPAAISVGRRPTFYTAADPLIEAHVLDFDGDLYGQAARVEFQAYLRREQRFDSVDALIAQMGLDVTTTRSVLGI